MAGGTVSEPALLPADAAGRQQVRALAAIVGCDIHPINNRRILEYLRKTFGADDDAINAWCGTWISAGFDAYEALLGGRRPARLFQPWRRADHRRLLPDPADRERAPLHVDLGRWPLIMAVEAACNEASKLLAPTRPAPLRLQP